MGRIVKPVGMFGQFGKSLSLPSLLENFLGLLPLGINRVGISRLRYPDQDVAGAVAAAMPAIYPIPLSSALIIRFDAGNFR